MCQVRPWGKPMGKRWIYVLKKQSDVEADKDIKINKESTNKLLKNLEKRLDKADDNYQLLEKKMANNYQKMDNNYQKMDNNYQSLEKKIDNNYQLLEKKIDNNYQLLNDKLELIISHSNQRRYK